MTAKKPVIKVLLEKARYAVIEINDTEINGAEINGTEIKATKKSIFI